MATNKDDSVVTYRSDKYGTAKTVVTREQRENLKANGRLIEDHGQPGRKR